MAELPRPAVPVRQAEGREPIFQWAENKSLVVQWIKITKIEVVTNRISHRVSVSGVGHLFETETETIPQIMPVAHLPAYAPLMSAVNGVDCRIEFEGAFPSACGGNLKGICCAWLVEISRPSDLLGVDLQRRVRAVQARGGKQVGALQQLLRRREVLDRLDRACPDDDLRPMVEDRFDQMPY